MDWLKYVPLFFMVPGVLFAFVVYVNSIIMRYDITEVELDGVRRYYTHKNHFLGHIVEWPSHLHVIPFHGKRKRFHLDELDEARSYLVHSTTNSFRYSMLHLWAKKVERDLEAIGTYNDE